MLLSLEECKQNWELSSKILRKMGQKEKNCWKENRWKKKQNRCSPTARFKENSYSSPEILTLKPHGVSISTYKS